MRALDSRTQPKPISPKSREAKARKPIVLRESWLVLRQRTIQSTHERLHQSKVQHTHPVSLPGPTQEDSHEVNPEFGNGGDAVHNFGLKQGEVGLQMLIRRIEELGPLVVKPCTPPST